MTEVEFHFRYEGQEQFSNLKQTLDLLGVPYQETVWHDSAMDPDSGLRRAEFSALDGRQLVAEEYFAYEHNDWDGGRYIWMETYEKGSKPTLYREIYHPRLYDYPDAPVDADGNIYPALRLNLSDRTYEYSDNDMAAHFPDEVEWRSAE